MTQRKVRIIDAETGKSLREAYIPEEKKFLGIFSYAEIIKGMIIVITVAFGAGIIWTNLNNHMDNSDQAVTRLAKSVDDFKNSILTAHREILDKMRTEQEEQNRRINCLSGNLKGNCEKCQVC